VKIYFDDNPEHPSAAISGNVSGLLAFAQALRDDKDVAVVCDQGPSTPYPRLLHKLLFKRTKEGSGGITITVEQDRLILSGDAQCADNLAQSIQNVFQSASVPGTHFHLDYFDGSGLLAPGNFGLIFQLEND
jgi:hypothetical protein